jgi:restriction system protein
LRARLPGAREKYLAKWDEGRVAYEAVVAAYNQREAERQQRLAAAQGEHQRAVSEIQARLAAQHAEVEQFASRYPDGFPQRFRLAYVPESRQLVVEYELPGYNRVPQ